MKIEDVLKEELIILELQSTDKKAVIEELITKLWEQHLISDPQLFSDAVWEREKQGTTGIGELIAIPHGKSDAVIKPAVVFGRSKAGIDFDSLDGQKAELFFLIAIPKAAKEEHLKLLSELSVLLLDPTIKHNLLNSESAAEIATIFASSSKLASDLKQPQDEALIVAVTGCATGIAHTYMAAEQLQKAAQAHNIGIIVETNGATGVDNLLRRADIQRAVGVIVASDINVEMERFQGKKVISVSVADGLNQAQQLISAILAGNVPIYQGHNDAVAIESEDRQESKMKAVYRHLLSGVSYMLPFVIGGGISIAIAFTIDQILGVPVDQLGSLGSYNVWATYFMAIGNLGFNFMLPILAGYIAYSISDRPGLVGGFVAGSIASQGGAGFLGAILGGFIAGYLVNWLKSIFSRIPKNLEGIKTILFMPVLTVILVGTIMVIFNIPMKALNNGLNEGLRNLSGTNALLIGALLGGMMAIDLGGPVNKAAYVFGTGTLAATVANGGSEIMAAVMAGGMVPPLSIFLATVLFRKKFNNNEKQVGWTNLVLGSSFITEGAIPFAAADPLRMIVSFVIGSAITGALVVELGIKVMAPHGGIFVIFLVSRPILYVLIIVLGSLISALCIGFLKRPKEKE